MKSLYYRTALRGLALLASCALALPAWALKDIQVRESDTVIVPVSLRDQTRIKVVGGRVNDVMGDIFDAKANPIGRVAVIHDTDDGEVYVKVVMPPPGALGAGGLPINPTAPVKLDFKSTLGAFALLLQPLDTPGETVAVRIDGAAPPPIPSAERFGKGPAHVRALKALTLAMANPALADGGTGKAAIVVRQVNREIALWREARFVLRSQHFANHLLGESFELTNVSNTRMVIDERELYTDGVQAVSVRHLILEPGDSTHVWIVRLAQSAPGAGATPAPAALGSPSAAAAVIH